MAITPNYDLDIDSTLGGDNASDYVIPSQKAIKSYVDNNTGSTVDQVYDPTSQAAQSGIAIAGANFLTSSDLTNYVTTNTDQNITGVKTYVGQKRIGFKQSGNSDKLGFTLYNSSNVEKGYLEFNPTNTIDGAPLMTLGNYATSTTAITHVGFRKYSNVSGASGAYNLLAPLISNAKTPFNLTTTYTNFYLPLGFTDGTTMVKAANTGVVDLSSLLPDVSNFVTNSSLATTLEDYQPLLVDGTNIKTINNTSLLGSGNIDVGTVTSVNNVSPVNGNVSLTIPTVTDTYSSTSSDAMSGKAVASAISSKQDSSTAVTHTASTAVGDANTPVYINSSGVATALSFTIATSVPSGAVFTDTKNTAGSTDTSSKIFLVGATSQADNPQTYSHDTVFVDTNGRLNSAAPASGANDTTVATTKWVKDQGYTTNTGTVTSVNNISPDANGNVAITIPTVNNNTITIQQGGTTVDSFTLNQSSNKTINIPKDIFIAEYDFTTFSDIVTAIDAGKMVFCFEATNSTVSPMTYIDKNNEIVFSGSFIDGLGKGTLFTYIVDSSNSWSTSQQVVVPTTTSSVTSGSTAALTSGGAYTNLITSVAAHSTDANKIVVTKAGSSSTITVDNVSNATTATYLGSTDVGSATQPIYLDDGTPTACTYTLAKSVPADAVFTDNDTKYTAGSSNSTSKLFLVGATAQGTAATNAQAKTTYSNSAVYEQNGYLYATTPASTQNDTTVATTKFVKDLGYTSNVGTVTKVNNTSPDASGNVALTIPTVNNATLTIQKNGTTVKTFTANASSNVTANITVPTKTSDLTNDSSFITGITSSDVTTALGYTPYSSANPSGYQANVIETIKVNNVAQTVTSKTVNITVPSAVTESTVSGWGFTKNTGTVTSVNNTQPDASGNVTISVTGGANTDLSNLSATGEAHFQSPLVSGTNIKTINNNSILGSGNVTITPTVTYDQTTQTLTIS